LARETIPGDRRSHRRYDLALGLRFRQVAGSRTILEGTGKIDDISSGGVLFLTGAPPAVGATVELLVDWPYRGENGSPLNLLVVGRVVRRSGEAVAVQTIRHEFRPVAQSGTGVKGARRKEAATVTP
jgi:hypothetical protein